MFKPTLCLRVWIVATNGLDEKGRADVRDVESRWVQISTPTKIKLYSHCFKTVSNNLFI